MKQLLIIDELDGSPHVDFDRREIGEYWESDVHVLIVLAGESNGPDYAVAHPTDCTDDCGVSFQLYEGGCEQPTSYPQVPTEPGLYLMRMEMVKGGWVTGDFAVDHDAYLTFEETVSQLSTGGT